MSISKKEQKLWSPRLYFFTSLANRVSVFDTLVLISTENSLKPVFNNKFLNKTIFVLEFEFFASHFFEA